MQEEWRTIYTYYKVSNTGRVVNTKNNRELKKQLDRYGYNFVGIRIDGKQKLKKVHRLVAMAFLPNYSEQLQVNHIDENKTNNCVSNLEMCDNKYNCNYGSRRTKSAKPVIQKTLEGTVIKEWPSIKEIKRVLGYNDYNIIACCKGYLKNHSNGKVYPVHHAYNFKWEYKNNN